MATAPVEYLTIKEAACELRVSTKTLYRLFELREILRVKIGRRRLIRRVELDRFVQRNTERPAQPRREAAHA